MNRLDQVFGPPEPELVGPPIPTKDELDALRMAIDQAELEEWRAMKRVENLARGVLDPNDFDARCTLGILAEGYVHTGAARTARMKKIRAAIEKELEKLEKLRADVDHARAAETSAYRVRSDALTRDVQRESDEWRASYPELAAEVDRADTRGPA